MSNASESGSLGSNPERRSASGSLPPPGSPGEAHPAPQHQTNKRRNIVHLKSPKSLERLRERVAFAASELQRLKEENAALAAEVSALRKRPPSRPFDARTVFNENPEAVRRKVEGFISAIDQYLEQEGNTA